MTIKIFKLLGIDNLLRTINNESMGFKSGQVLILVLLTVIVVLTIGLSVASRNITNLRTTTQTEQSQRAFTAAEGGIEDVLSSIDTPSFQNNYRNAETDAGDTQQVLVGDLNATVNVKASAVYDGLVGLGDVLQINLETFGSDQPIQIEWALVNTVEVDGPDGIASLELTEINDIFGQVRYYFEGENRGGNETSVEGFSSSIAPCTPSSGFEKCVVINTSSTGAPKILRIKPFWANTTVRVFGVLTKLPIQIYDITSTAQSEIGVTRSVQVTRSTLPRLPAVFDYVLFSEQDIIK